jgi:hypothetical protein
MINIIYFEVRCTDSSLQVKKWISGGCSAASRSEVTIDINNKVSRLGINR